MNIEIANRLVELRKANNLSQEALAEKLGISRQAVSKWERAEASPDTDNLILLARLYQVSLDELLRTDEEILPNSNSEEADSGMAQKETMTEDAANNETAEDPEEYVHIGFQGVHVKDKDGEVHVGWNGIHVVDAKDEVHIDKNGVHVNGEELEDHIFKHQPQIDFPLGTIAVITYIAIGCIYNLWHPGWLIFFLVPIISSAIQAVRQKNIYCFAYPVLAILVFLYSGLVKMIWHPTWVVFLTIPLWYEMIRFFKRKE